MQLDIAIAISALFGPASFYSRNYSFEGERDLVFPTYKSTVKYDRFWTRRYRVLLHLWRKFRFRDLLGVLLFILAAILAVIGKDPSITIPILVAYFLIAGGRAALGIRARELKFGVQGRVIAGLFNFMNNELFSSSNKTRFTLFRQAPFRGSYIVPWWRYKRSGDDPIKEADKSCSRYSQDEGLTGRVWADPADALAIQILPDFQGNRALMEAYYIGNLKVPAESAMAISDYMTKVRAIVSYAFLDPRGTFLGLLSLDISDADVELGRNMEGISIQTSDGSIVIVDADRLYLLTRAVGNVLESFQLQEEGVL